MAPWLSLGISILALTISGITAWLTFFRRGRILMTQPTMVFFGPDGSHFDIEKNKIYLRTLLYSTAKRGHVIESLYVSLQRNESKQNFNIWVYGEKGNLNRGSGLFISQEGLTFDHHFLLPADGADFIFKAGAYQLVVFAKLVGESASHELMKINLTITESQAAQLLNPFTGIYFDWSPDQQSYHSHTEAKSNSEGSLKQIAELIAKKNS